LEERLIERQQYIVRYGENMPDIGNWKSRGQGADP
jgi:phosphoketolase